MSESICLHIQGRESGPIRVVELPWISARIGRSPHCEVRLSEHDLPDEACRLKKRGRSWHLEPVGARSQISVDGRLIEGSCLLPFDVPFYIGSYCLTLRRDRAAEPNWEMYRPPNLALFEQIAPLLDAIPASAEKSRTAPVAGR